MRCKGRKKLYKVRGAYSHTNTGGIEVECPMCNGVGRVKTLDAALKDANEKVKTAPPEKKDLKDAEKEGKKRKPVSRAEAAS